MKAPRGYYPPIGPIHQASFPRRPFCQIVGGAGLP